jgi:hypothetical protein
MRELQKIELVHVHGGMSGPVTQVPQLPRAYWLRNLDIELALDPPLDMHSDGESSVVEVETSLQLLERQPAPPRDWRC